MKISQVDILIHPGLSGGGPDYWYAGWLRKLKNGTKVEQNWAAPNKEIWVDRLVDMVTKAARPVILIGHSMGVITTVHAAPLFEPGKVKGAFLVAPPDPERLARDFPECRSFCPTASDPLPFPSLLVASRNDPHCRYEISEDLSYAWGSRLLDAGEAGHITPQSGHGPWPEGMLRLASFLNGLS